MPVRSQPAAVPDPATPTPATSRPAASDPSAPALAAPRPAASEPATPAVVVTDPARPDAPNEDSARLAPGIAVLADGAGVGPAWRAGCSHSVAWYSHALTNALAAALADPELTMRDALAQAITEVASLHADTCDLERGGPSATVVAVRERDGMLEHLVLCDSSLLLLHRDGSIRRITDLRVDEVAARERTPAAVEAQRNAPGGFWLARHEPEAAEQALIGATPLVDLDAAILVSDGVTRAVDLLDLGDDADLARRCRTAGGAQALIAEIRTAEGRLVECGAGPRKPHDDATIAIHPVGRSAPRE